MAKDYAALAPFALRGHSRTLAQVKALSDGDTAKDFFHDAGSSRRLCLDVPVSLG